VTPRRPRAAHRLPRLSTALLAGVVTAGAAGLACGPAPAASGRSDAGANPGAAAAASSEASEAAEAAVADTAPQRLTARVVAVYPHDPKAYTQGLVWHGGELLESTGQYGSSTLRRVRPATGEVLQSVSLPPSQFGEGLALIGEGDAGRLVQLTWQEGIAPIWDLSLTRRGEHRYQGEGWGLCFDGTRLVMSDGSDRLTLRDPASFAVLGEVRVTREGVPVDQLNELECAGGAVWANIWHRDEIVRIDPASGRVTGVVDASRLLSPGERLAAEVLNGIAYDPGGKRFFVTGKYWPKLFEVVFEPPAGPR
jgi:glutaminyl-peptide cyclotransferase